MLATPMTTVAPLEVRLPSTFASMEHVLQVRGPIVYPTYLLTASFQATFVELETSATLQLPPPADKVTLVLL